ncbi:GRIP and coiled-coil domain-containing protein 1-like [Sycon ciliatum]|uniref:GRIP and coiled-coil domain-containing protein 1-like n=1 Tax=Sycon ciliatum TaxID=27933 RepID=UPI0020ABDF2E|eukprot:scpid43086/ scgid27335/ GRIP and coiled-coil domain-containing protein 1; Golgi coiled-coil protein 1
MEKSRAELLKTIESQGEQIGRYENRLRDIVSAYKGLLSEKEALEASVSALSKSPSTTRTQEVRNARAADASGSSAAASEDEGQGTRLEGGGNAATATAEDSSGQESGQSDDLSARLATLTASLATISAEKSRMEASFQAGKKLLLQENENLQRQHREDSKQLRSEIDQLKGETEKLRQRLRIQQQQHDQEQTNHAAMLRELQQLLAEERMAKDDVELKLENAETSSVRQVATTRAEHDQLMCKLNAEIKSLRSELAERGKTNQDDTVILQQVQVQMAQMKLQHSESLSKERQRVVDAEQRISTVSRREEERVTSLEAQLAELTVMVGRYDRLREQDQQSISHLQGQMSDINKQNVDLREQLSEAQTDDAKKEVLLLRERLGKLHLLLKEANPDSLAALDADNDSLGDEKIAEQLHQTCEQRYKNLFDEFEAFKATQRSTKDGSSEELRRLHGQMRHLRDRLQPMQQQLDTSQSCLRERDLQLEHVQSRLEEEKLDHQKALSAALATHQQELLSVQSARERSYALLQDREAEIEKLRAQLAGSGLDDWTRSSSVFTSSQRHSSSGGGGGTGASPVTSPGTVQNPFIEGRVGSVDQAVEDLMGHSNHPFPSATASNSLLHYAQQQQRVAAEVEHFRSQRDDLLAELRDCRERAERYEEQCGLLKEEIRKMDRNKDRGTASLEYLKNVVLSYMTLDGYSPGRIHIANAIATILQFSPEERQKAVHSANASSWWPPAAK